MKEITIDQDVYDLLVEMKKEGESVSDVIVKLFS